MARRRKRGLFGRIVIGLTVAAGRHSRRHARRAAAAAGRATGPKVIRRASDEYGAKRKAGAPIPDCPVNPVETSATPVWEFEAMVGPQYVQFKLLEDTSIRFLDETEMITYTLIAACHAVHSERPIDENWPITWIGCTNNAAREHFGDLGTRPTTPGMH